MYVSEARETESGRYSHIDTQSDHLKTAACLFKRFTNLRELDLRIDLTRSMDWDPDTTYSPALTCLQSLSIKVPHRLHLEYTVVSDVYSQLITTADKQSESRLWAALREELSIVTKEKVGGVDHDCRRIARSGGMLQQDVKMYIAPNSIIL